MNHALIGDLTQFKLVDIMKLLSGRSKTGKLQIENMNQEGTIFFHKGKITHAMIEGSTGEQAVLDMSIIASGKFLFLPDVTADEETVASETNKLVSDCYKRIAEIEAIKKVIPSLEAVYRMVTDQFTKDVSFSPHELEIFSEIDGERSISEIAQELKMDQMKVLKTFYKMFVAGMLEFVEQTEPAKKESVDPEKINEIEKILIKAVGPIASVIMDDQISDFNFSREDFPKEFIPQLVESISKEITSEERRIEFQQEILVVIKEIAS